MTRRSWRREVSDLFRDERGRSSMARVMFTITLFFALVLIVLDSIGRIAVQEAAWTLLGGALMGILAWTAGPRIAQHLNIGAVTQAISSAAKRREGTDDRRRDSERGD